MITMFKSIFRSFGYAFQGIISTVRKERNFRIHLVAVVLVTWVAFLYEVTAGQALVLVILFGLVLSLELINTAVEKTVDLITRERHPLAKKAKDAAAGAVLIGAITSVVSALILFRDGEKWALVWQKMAHPARIVALVVFVVLALLFVWGGKKKNKK